MLLPFCILYENRMHLIHSQMQREEVTGNLRKSGYIFRQSIAMQFLKNFYLKIFKGKFIDLSAS